MLILGVNAYHGDAAAALLVDGELVAAAEEERFNRIKHWAGFPARPYSIASRSLGPGLRTWITSRSGGIRTLISATR